MPKVLTLEKSLSVLESIFYAKNGVGTRTLAKQLTLNVATVHNIAMTFCQRGYLRQDPETKLFFPGIRLMLLGRHPSYLRSLTAAARSIVHELSEKQNESVMLGTIDHGRVINLEYVPSKQALRVHEPEELRELAYCTAVGKVLLSSLTQAELEAYLRDNPLHRFTPSTITDPQLLKEELATIRSMGHGKVFDELTEGISALAVPIRDPWGTVIAGLGMSAPSVRLTKPNSLQNHLKALHTAATKIERAWNATILSEPSPGKKQKSSGEDT